MKEEKQCPYCSSAIPATASVCSSCGVDPATGRPVRLGSGVESTSRTQVGVADSEPTRPMTSSIRLAEPFASVGQTEMPTKSCINCGIGIPVHLLICPACSTDQQRAASRIAEQKARRKSRTRRAMVALFTIVLVLSGLSVLGYIYRVPLKCKIEEWRAASRRPSKTPVPATRAASPSASHKSAKRRKTPSSRKTRAVCMLCNGEGYYMRNPTDREACPICMRMGHRKVTVREGTRLCPDCRGMGKVEDKIPQVSPSRVRQGLRRRARRCERCRGSGLVRAG